MNNPLLAELMRETWAMEPRALEGFLQTMARLDPRVNPAMEPAGEVHLLPASGRAELYDDFRVEQTTASTTSTSTLGPIVARAEGGPFDEAPRRSRLSVAEGVGTIQISGVLLKRVPNLARWWGIEATSYGEIQSDLAQAMGDDGVKSIRIKIESPGGMVSGVKETADAIYQAATKKDIKAEIQDLGASAAYWLASQADSITANPNATVGSLGAYTAYPDYSKAAEMEGIKIHVIASGPHKGMGVPGAPITEEQLSPIRDLINGIASGFHADISRGRGMDKEKTKPWMTGQVWRAEEAAEIGIIDAVKSTSGNSTSPGVPAAALAEKEETMANETEKAAAEEKIRSEAAGAERKRLADMNAAFPGEEKFVMEQYAAGATVEKAAVAFVAVQKGRIEAKDAEIATLKTKPAVAVARPSGAAPIPVGGDPAAQAGPSFIEAAEELVASGKAKNMTDAMSKLAKGDIDHRNSVTFNKHVEACEAQAPEHLALKRKAGVN